MMLSERHRRSYASPRLVPCGYPVDDVDMKVCMKNDIVEASLAVFWHRGGWALAPHGGAALFVVLQHQHGEKAAELGLFRW